MLNTNDENGMLAKSAFGGGPYSEIVMSARDLCRGVSLVTALTVLLGIGVAAEAGDLRGAWVTDESTCKKVFTGERTKLGFAKDADVYGSGFIYEGNRLIGKMRTALQSPRRRTAMSCIS